MRKEDGFTIIELLVASIIIAVVTTLGAYAISHYSKLRALEGSTNEVITELRAMQQDAGSRSHPWVSGVYFKAGTNRWGIVEGNIKTGVCTRKAARTFPAGVTVSTATFSDIATQSLTANCTTAAESGAEVVLFFARGSATSGSMSLVHPNVGSGARTLTVSPITGRVTRS